MEDIPRHVRVKVTPDAGEEDIEKVNNSTYVIAVREPAEGGKANKRVRELIADHFQIHSSRVRIVKGHKAPKKILEIDENKKT